MNPTDHPMIMRDNEEHLSWEAFKVVLEQLLAAVQRWCAEDSASQGLVLDTGNARYLDFYQRHGYREIGEVTLGAVREHVLLHPGETPAAT